MNGLSGTLTAPWKSWRARRATDIAQARRIAAARHASDAAWRGLNWGGCSPDGRSVVHVPRTETDMSIARAGDVLSRAQANGSDRARMWAAQLYTWGRLSPPLSRRRQDEILAARRAARDQRGDVMDEVRTGRITRAQAGDRLANWQPYTHPRDPLARGGRGRSR